MHLTPSVTCSSTSHSVIQVPPSTSLSPRRVLVVDDDKEVREALGELLTDEGYEVSAAPNGQQALTKVLLQAPDVVLLDLVMPVMSGWEFLQFRPWYPELGSFGIIVMSAALEEPPDVAAVISKPFLLEDLLKTVRRVAGPRLPSREVPRRRA